MADFTTDFGSFSDTTITVTPVTDAAKAVFAEMFGGLVDSIKIRKSAGPDFAASVEARGLSIR